MSALRGIATGFLQAKIRNTEANDALKANTLMRVGETLIGETIPNAVAAEKVRRTNYDMLSSEFTPNFAEVADKSGFTLNEDTMDVLRKKLEEGNLDKEALKNANFETDFNTRYNARVKTDEEKYAPILKQLGIDGIGAMGYNTVEAIVKPPAMDTVTTKDQMTDTVTTQEVPKPFSSMQLKDYLTPVGDTTVLGNPNLVAGAAASYRGFDQSMNFVDGKLVSLKFGGNKDIEYNAFTSTMNDVAPMFERDDGKVNLQQIAQAADERLTAQTQGTINKMVSGYNVLSAKDKSGMDLSAIEKTQQLYGGGDFSESFNAQNPSDSDKLTFIAQHMGSLGTTAEQHYFALSFPVNVTLSDGRNIRKLLLRRFTFSN
nr:hypothetical protein [uncultured Mediterranean phage uvMED]